MSANLLARMAGAARSLRLTAGGECRVPGAVVFAYHDIGSDPANRTDYYVSADTMRRQLTSAAEWGIRFIDLAELSRMVIAGECLDGLAAVVFDDSLVGVHHDAMPVLVDLGIPATVFTVSAALGQAPPWWPGAARVMTRGEVQEVVAAGIRVASHTRTHASLPNITRDAITSEVTGARSELEDLTQSRVDLFAYPFGHYDPRVVDEVKEAGYICAYTFLNGRITPGLDEFRLPRLNMWNQSRTRLAYHLSRSAASWPDHQLPHAYGDRGEPNLQRDGR